MSSDVERTDNKPPSEFWKHWWNEQAKSASSDYALNRMTSIRLGKLEQRELDQFLKAVAPKPQDQILDAGCGTGRNVALLSPNAGHITGIDYSDEMVRRAADRIHADGLKNVEVRQADVTRLPFSADSFDKVICISVLQYLNDDECARALRELVRVGKPGGSLILHLKNGTSLYGLSLAILRPIARVLGKEMKPEFYRSRRWHIAVLESLGCQVRNYYGFGLLTFVPLPQKIVALLLRWEVEIGVPRFFQRFAVNFKITADIRLPSDSSHP